MKTFILVLLSMLATPNAIAAHIQTLNCRVGSDALKEDRRTDEYIDLKCYWHEQDCVGIPATVVHKGTKITLLAAASKIDMSITSAGRTNTATIQTVPIAWHDSDDNVDLYDRLAVNRIVMSLNGHSLSCK